MPLFATLSRTDERAGQLSPTRALQTCRAVEPSRYKEQAVALQSITQSRRDIWRRKGDTSMMCLLAIPTRKAIGSGSTRFFCLPSPFTSRTLLWAVLPMCSLIRKRLNLEISGNRRCGTRLPVPESWCRSGLSITSSHCTVERNAPSCCTGKTGWGTPHRSKRVA